MTERTHPDSGRTTGGIVEMLQDRVAELEAQLEAQLEAIGAGGVNGPLIGQPQAMPDLTALTERGAKAWTGVDAQGLREGGAGFTAADMATAAAQGFRDGVASVAANAGSEPIAWLVCTEEGDPSMVFLDQREAQMFLEDDERPTPLYSHSSPPEGMAGWKLVPIEPTLDMGWAYLDAARESEPLRTHSFNHAGYRAMIAAAPPLPASEAKEPI